MIARRFLLWTFRTSLLIVCVLVLRVLREDLRDPPSKTSAAAAPIKPITAAPAQPRHVQDRREDPDPAQQHPADALARAYASRTLTWQTRRALVFSLAQEHPEEVARWAVGRPGAGDDLAYVLRAALWNWTLSSPAEALNWALSIQEQPARDFALRPVFQALASVDPASAAGRLMDIENFPGRGLAAGMLMLYWARLDRDAAARWAWSLPEGPERREALAALLNVLYQQQPGLAEDLAGAAGSEGLGTLLAPDQPGLGAEWLRQHLPGGQGRHTAFQLQLADWARNNPGEALLLADLLSDPALRELLVAVLAEGLGREDPEGGMRLAMLIPGYNGRYQAAYRILSDWYQVDPEGAETYMGSVDDEAVEQAVEEVREDSESSTAGDAPEQETVKQDEPLRIEDTLGWTWSELATAAEQLPPGEMRNGLVHRAAVEWAADPAWPPSVPAAWAMALLPDGRTEDHTLRVLLWNWAGTDLAAAAAWTSTLSADLQDRGFATLCMSTADRDPEQATALLDSIQSYAVRKDTLGNLAFRLGSIDERGALAWANGIEDEELRLYALDRIAAAIQ